MDKATDNECLAILFPPSRFQCRLIGHSGAMISLVNTDQHLLPGTLNTIGNSQANNAQEPAKWLHREKKKKALVKQA